MPVDTVNLVQSRLAARHHSNTPHGRLVFPPQVKEVKPTLATWQSMVDARSTEDIGNVGQLDKIFGSMDRRGWRPSRAVQLHAACAYARARDWHKAIAWFEPAVRREHKTVHFALPEVKQCFFSLRLAFFQQQQLAL